MRGKDTLTYREVLSILKRHSTELGLRETARRMGFSHATLSRVLRGHPPSYETLGDLARKLALDGIVVERRPSPRPTGAA